MAKISAKMKKNMRKSTVLLDLPSEIMIDIHLKLPTRTILSCKCVCKKFLELLSTPSFAASHLALATPGLIIHQSGDENLCQIFEFQDGFELQHSNLHCSPAMKFDPGVSIGLLSTDLRIVGSVNGLLCLWDHKGKLHGALYICNPITREYITLPRIQGAAKYRDVQYGFGVSEMGQYKVVVNVHSHIGDDDAPACLGIENYECYIYTLGTGSWRRVQAGVPFGHFDLLFGSYLNGNLHGCVVDYCGFGDVLSSCFDLESESFQPFPLPPPHVDPPTLGTMGILDGCLCVVDNSYKDLDTVGIWVMKEYGVESSWTQQVVITEVSEFVPCYSDPVYPVKAFQNGDILLCWNNFNLFYYNNETKTCQYTDLVVQKKGGWIEAVSHSSSFLSLKSFQGENVKLFSCEPMQNASGRVIRQPRMKGIQGLKKHPPGPSKAAGTRRLKKRGELKMAR
ncbi:F-box protein CPR1-like isoform X2 [Henckelia pumila]|uniref:F-box protein CPR1-like isoform X2 n=1 Tax=Henckelia pumila TaxID=405737 RepID=UPI003C6E247A